MLVRLRSVRGLAEAMTVRSSSPPHLKHLHSPSCDMPIFNIFNIVSW
jgi:hypothetical protein